jgi:predicted ATPase
MLTRVAIAGYRSLHNLVVPLKRLNIVTGANGTGKSNLYRALRLLADTAQGNVVQSLAHEGGLASTLWAGPEVISRSMKRGDHPIEGTVRRFAVGIRLGFGGDEFGYFIDLGLPTRDRVVSSLFTLDPHIKRECIWHGEQFRPSTLLVDRRGAVVRLQRDDGVWDGMAQNLAPYDSVTVDPARKAFWRNGDFQWGRNGACELALATAVIGVRDAAAERRTFWKT